MHLQPLLGEQLACIVPVLHATRLFPLRTVLVFCICLVPCRQIVASYTSEEDVKHLCGSRMLNPGV